MDIAFGGFIGEQARELIQLGYVHVFHCDFKSTFRELRLMSETGFGVDGVLTAGNSLRLMFKEQFKRAH